MFNFLRKNKKQLPTIKENPEILSFTVKNIWKNKEKIVNSIIKINKILNKKYKENWVHFFVDPSYEKGFAISINWLENDIGASLRIISDDNILDQNRKTTFFNDWVEYFYSFKSYDIQYTKEYGLLIEAAKLFIEINYK